MNKLLPIIGLFVATGAAVVVYPGLKANTQVIPPVQVAPPAVKPAEINLSQVSAPSIDLVFVLDTTSSMDGFIETAKEKIWSIATTMTSAQQTPDIRIGLVAFRDRGDSYITKTIDLSDDIDSVYAALMDFEARGGGDGPESVNKGLYDAVNELSWSQNPNNYQTIFLVGDAPPHMDYRNDVKYAETVAEATRRGIVINTIQCGQDSQTTSIWKDIAQLGGGKYFRVDQSGGGVAMNTPYDEQLATLSAELDGTRMYFGSELDKELMEEKVEATRKLHASSSLASRARRGVFNSSGSGRKNSLGSNELVDAVTSGRVRVEELNDEELPAELVAMDTQAKEAAIEELATAREGLEIRIRELSKKRESYIKEELAKAPSPTDSLDYKLYEAVRDQGAEVGLTYDSGPEY